MKRTTTAKTEDNPVEKLAQWITMNENPLFDWSMLVSSELMVIWVLMERSASLAMTMEGEAVVVEGEDVRCHSSMSFWSLTSSRTFCM